MSNICLFISDVFCAQNNPKHSILSIDDIQNSLILLFTTLNDVYSVSKIKVYHNHRQLLSSFSLKTTHGVVYGTYHSSTNGDRITVCWHISFQYLEKALLNKLFTDKTRIKKPLHLPSVSVSIH